MQNPTDPTRCSWDAASPQVLDGRAEISGVLLKRSVRSKQESQRLPALAPLGLG